MAISKPDGVTEAVQAGVRGPRRAAVQALAGLAALGAAAGSESAVGKKKGKDKKKGGNKKGWGGKGNSGGSGAPSGVLLSIKVIDNAGFADPGEDGTAVAQCPAPTNNQVVFVLGGGISVVDPDLRFLDALADNVENPPVYTVQAHNTNTSEVREFGAQAICGYFRK